MRFWITYYLDWIPLWWQERQRRLGRLKPCVYCLADRCDECKGRGCACFWATCEAASLADQELEGDQDA